MLTKLSRCHSDRARDRFPLREEGGSLASIGHRSVHGVCQLPHWAVMASAMYPFQLWKLQNPRASLIPGRLSDG